MRAGLVILGAILVIAGIVLEGVYLFNPQMKLFGTNVSSNTYLVTGLVFVFGGLLLSWAGLRIPKLRALR